jgi:hypothetical protein
MSASNIPSEPQPDLDAFERAAKAKIEKLLNEYDSYTELHSEALEEFLGKIHKAFTDLAKDLFHPVQNYLNHLARLQRQGFIGEEEEGAGTVINVDGLREEEKLAGFEAEMRAKQALFQNTAILSFITQWMTKTLDDQVRPYILFAKDLDVFSWKAIGSWYNQSGEALRKRFRFDAGVGVPDVMGAIYGDIWSSDAFWDWVREHSMVDPARREKMAKILLDPFEEEV